MHRIDGPPHHDEKTPGRPSRRERIVAHIGRNPGVHLRALHRETGIPLGTVEYHVRRLEREGAVVRRQHGRQAALFPADGIDRRDRDVMCLLRQDVPRRILMELLHAPGLSHTDLAARVGVSRSTCSHHLDKLKPQLVRTLRDGRNTLILLKDPQRVADLLLRYRETFLDPQVDLLARTARVDGLIADAVAAGQTT